MGITAAAALALRETIRRSHEGEDPDEAGASGPHGPRPAKPSSTGLSSTDSRSTGPSSTRPSSTDSRSTGPRPTGCTEETTGLRQLTIVQLDLAIDTLQQAPHNEFEVAIHESRKAIKRVRSLERLLRQAYPRSHREPRKDLLRDAARALSGARDAQVALSTLEGLLRRHPRRLSGHPGVAKLHAALLTEHNAAERAVEQSGARERSQRLLSTARKQLIEDRPLRGRRREAGIADVGLIRIYAKGRGSMRRARKRPGIAELHEWRKRVKDLRHATEALGQSKRERRARKRLLQIARDADALGEALGEEHDLALLAQRVEREDEIFRGDKRGRKELRRAIRRRRARLRKRASKAGMALYAHKPKRFKRQLRRTH